MLNGIDISNHNWALPPTSVPGSFVIMRASEGRGLLDERFAAYDAQVRPSNRLPGAYHFAWVSDGASDRNEPEDEAANFAAAIQDHLRPGFLVVLDWEPKHDALNTDWAVECGLEIRRRTGRTPILYANHSTLHAGRWARWRREIGTAYWLAGGTPQYDMHTEGYAPGPRPANPSGFGEPSLWQYTEMGFLPGWNLRLDLNVFNGAATQWRTLADS